MSRHTPILTGLLLLLALVAGGAAAEPCTYLVEPTVVTRSAGKPNVREWTFSSPVQQLEVTIENDLGEGWRAVTSAEVTLNGESLAGPSQFRGSPTVLRITATSQVSNVLRVVLRGAPGSALRISVAPVQANLNPAEGTWTEGPSPLAPWSGHGAAVIGRTMYVVGGQLTAAEAHAFDLDARTWRRLADIPAATVHAGVTVLHGRVHVVGGQDPALHANMRAGHFAYDPATDTWETLAPLPLATTHAPAVTLDGRIFVLGGQIGPWQTPSQTSAVHVYDPATDTWSPGVPLPTPREWIQAGVIDGRIYAAGGYQGPFNHAPPSQTRVDAFDPLTQSWSDRQPLPEGVQGAAFCAAGPYLVLVGGWDVQFQVNHLDRMYVYDTRVDSWARGPDTEGPNYYASAAAVDCELLLLGGGNSPWVMNVLRPE